MSTAHSQSPNSPQVSSHRVRRWLRRAVFAVVAVLTLIVLFYAVENWRGRRAWARSEKELRAQAVPLDWTAYVPEPVPDAENFIKTPLLEAVGYRGRVDSNVWAKVARGQSRLPWAAWGDFQAGRVMDWEACQAALRHQTNLHLSPLPQSPAADLREALRIVEPELEELRAASLRPRAQFDIDRTAPFEESPDINFVAVRDLSQYLGFHACAELKLGRAGEAMADLRVIHQFSAALKNETTLVATMIGVALQGILLQPFWEGWAEGRWSEQELADCQALFRQTDLLSDFIRVMHAEQAGVTALVTKYGIQRNQLWRLDVIGKDPAQLRRWSVVRRLWLKLLWGLVPRGWVYQNLAFYNHHMRALLPPSLQDQPPILVPAEVEQIKRQMRQEESWAGFYRRLVRIAVPNFIRAAEITARHQTRVNQARVVCALERYRRAGGQYPEALSDLVPQFMESLPLDVINGRPLLYRRGADGQFLLYSVGWNETDDGGTSAMTEQDPPQPDYTRGDWVWRYPSPGQSAD